MDRVNSSVKNGAEDRSTQRIAQYGLLFVGLSEKEFDYERVNLKEKVKERTAELETAKRGLEEEVKRRTDELSKEG